MVMVLGVVNNKRDFMPSHVFKAGLKMNNNVYINVLTKV
jgi:hypothetical protein